MKNSHLFNKKFLENLVSDSDAFTKAFEKTHGYILYRCQKEGVDVPLDMVRNIKNYSTYPICIPLIKDFPTVNEILMLNIPTQDTVISTEFWFSVDGAVETEGTDSRKKWIDVIKGAKFDRPLNLKELLAFEDILYPSLFEELNQTSKYYGAYNLVPLIKESLEGLSKAELEKTDPRLMAFSEFKDIYKKNKIDFSKVPNIGMRNESGPFYESGFLSNGKKMAQNFKKFQNKFPLEHIDKNIWNSQDSIQDFFSDFFIEYFGDTQKPSISISIPSALSAWLLNNKDFLFAVSYSEPDDIFLSIYGDDITYGDIVDGAQYNISFFSNFMSVDHFGNSILNSMDGVNGNVTLSAFCKLLVESSSKFPKYESESNQFSSKELNAILGSDIMMEFFKKPETLGKITKKILASGSEDEINLVAQIWSVSVLKDAEYGLDPKLRSIGGNINFFVKAIEYMPISLSKHMVARALLLKMKKDESISFTGENFEKLKELMAVPETLKTPLNKYLKYSAIGKNFTPLTNEDIKILENYGDPNYNNVRKTQKSFLLGSNEKVEIEERDDGVPFSFMRIISENVPLIDEYGILVENPEKFNEDVSLFHESDFYVDRDELLDTLSNSLMIVLEKTSLTKTLLDIDYDGFTLNRFDKNNLTENELQDELMYNCHVRNLAFCLSIVDRRHNEFKPAGDNSKLLEDVFKRLNIDDFTQDILDKFSYIVKNLGRTSLVKFNGHSVSTDKRDTTFFSILTNYRLREKILPVEDAVKNLSVFSSSSSLYGTEFLWGKKDFFNAALKFNPSVATMFVEKSSTGNLVLADNWNDLKLFLNREISINKENNIFITSDSSSCTIKVDTISLLTDSIADQGRKLDADGNADIEDPKIFFKIINELQTENPIGYVVLHSEMNIREFLREFNSWAKNNNEDFNSILINGFNIKAYSDGLWQLFEQKMAFNEVNNVILQNDDIPNLTINSFYISQALLTVDKLPGSIKAECLEHLLEKASNSKYKETANKLFNYYLNEGYGLENLDVLNLLVKSGKQNSGSQKMKNFNISNFLNMCFSEKEENNLLVEVFDLFKFGNETSNIAKEMNTLIDNDSVSLIKGLDKSPEHLMVIDAMEKEKALTSLMKYLTPSGEDEVEKDNQPQEETFNSFKI